MSKESDSIVVVVSEETGKISIAKDGNLIVDVKEEALRQILIKNIVNKRFADNKEVEKRARLINKKRVKKDNIKKEDKG